MHYPRQVKNLQTYLAALLGGGEDKCSDSRDLLLKCAINSEISN